MEKIIRDKENEKFKKASDKMLSLREHAIWRIQGECDKNGRKFDHYVQNDYVREAVIYIPKKGIFLTKNSPILENPLEAIQTYENGETNQCYSEIMGGYNKNVARYISNLINNRDGNTPEKEFYLNDEQIAKSLENSVQIPQILLVSGIPTKEHKYPSWLTVRNEPPFGEEPITEFCFENVAKKYGAFLNSKKPGSMCYSGNGTSSMRLFLKGREEIDKHPMPFAKQLWFSTNNENTDIVDEHSYIPQDSLREYLTYLGNSPVPRRHQSKF